MKFGMQLLSTINRTSLVSICLFIASILIENNLSAQNTSLLNSQILMNNTAGEINSFNIFHIVSNPANLNSLKKFNIGIYGERKFNLKELSNHVIVSGFSLGKIKMGLMLQQAGSTKFNQYSLGLCLSKKIGDNTSLAIQSKLMTNNISKLPNRKFISAEIGLVTNLSKPLRLGIKAENYLSYDKQTSLDNTYVLIISTGVFYQISKQFSLNVSCFKTSNESTYFSGNMKYQAHKNISMKLGYASKTNATLIDVSYSGKKMNLSFILTIHPLLGITPATSISTINE